MAGDPYLIANPPVRAQYRSPRRSPISGTVIVHVTDDGSPAMHNWVPAANVANFIRTRPDAGSYHMLIEPEGVLELLPPEVEAFQAETGSNRWAYSVSFCCDPLTFNLREHRTLDALHYAATVIASFAVNWATAKGNPRDAHLVARKISGSDAQLMVPGWCEHWEVQEYNRQDMCRMHPQRAAIIGLLSALIVEEIDELIAPQPEPEEDDMGILVKNKSGNGILHVFGGVVELASTEDATALINAGVKQISVSETTWKRYKAQI